MAKRRKTKKGGAFAPLIAFLSKKRPRRRRKTAHSGWPLYIRWGLTAGCWIGVAGFIFLIWCAWDLPGTWHSPAMPSRHAITLLDEEDGIIARFGDLRGDNIRVADLPPYVRETVLATEDRRFYDHFGIDPLGILRAMGVNLLAGEFRQGGSTITQQLAKNLFLTQQKTLRRKAQEAILALWLETQFTKDEILSAYLNRVYFGAGAYGIDAAANVYFNKRAVALDRWETAVLIGLLKAPSRYSPSSNPDQAAQRARVVLSALEDAGYITPEKRDQLARRDLAFVRKQDATGASLYFADWILEQLADYVTILDDDIIVRTTLAPALQKTATERAVAFVAQRGPKEAFAQTAVTVLLPDGAVKAMVGGVNYRQSQFNRATQAKRQPGSAFKPFVYLAAIEGGAEPDDVIEDTPLTQGQYRPENFGRKYHGAVTLADALAFSLNSVAVRLAQRTGISAVIDVARRFGISSDLRPDMSLALGSSEVTPLELTAAYAALANGGFRIEPYAITRIENKQGLIIYQHEAQAFARAASPRDVATLKTMMEGVVERGTARGAFIPNAHIAGKTGTSEGSRDAWFIGFTDDIVGSVWVGNDDNSPMNDVTGGGAAAYLWREVLGDTLARHPLSYHPPRGLKGSNFLDDILNDWTEGRFKGDKSGKTHFNP